MTIFIIGGSNSIVKDGWSRQLSHAANELDVVNLAVGNTSSIMGYYRIIMEKRICPGDTVIWEYALNDEEKADSGEVPVSISLRYLELTIISLIERGALFLPLIFSARNNAILGRYSVYRIALDELLSRYEIRSIDITAEYCAKFDKFGVPPQQYLHRVHYRSDSEIVKIVVESCLALLRYLKPPRKIDYTCLNSDPKKVLFHDYFNGGVSFRFTNRLVDILVHRPIDNSPLVATPQSGSWRFIGAILLRNKQPGTITFSCKQGVVNTRSNHVIHDFEKPLLGMAHFFSVKRIISHLGAPLTIAINSNMDQSNLSDAREARSECGVVALHFEADSRQWKD